MNTKDVWQIGAYEKCKFYYLAEILESQYKMFHLLCHVFLHLDANTLEHSTRSALSHFLELYLDLLHCAENNVYKAKSITTYPNLTSTVGWQDRMKWSEEKILTAGTGLKLGMQHPPIWLCNFYPPSSIPSLLHFNRYSRCVKMTDKNGLIIFLNFTLFLRYACEFLYFKLSWSVCLWSFSRASSNHKIHNSFIT